MKLNTSQKYSPFLNPREETFSQSKNIVGRDGRVQETNDPITQVRKASRCVTNKEFCQNILIGKSSLPESH
ncbi:hypothetical protein HZS_1947 [Henneguya salminicola]|nr:hypothetical protein HZS_1947 [Henneguya salminicola]